MIIHNDFVLLLLRKLCVRQILPVTHPRFSPPMQHDTYDRYDYDIPEKGSVSIQSPPLLPPLLAIVYILANLYWVLLKKVREYIHLCLMLQAYTSVVKKATITLTRMPRKVELLHKTFFRNTGHYYANNH